MIESELYGIQAFVQHGRFGQNNGRRDDALPPRTRKYHPESFHT
jgi:hypothetical protein